MKRHVERRVISGLNGQWKRERIDGEDDGIRGGNAGYSEHIGTVVLDAELVILDWGDAVDIAGVGKTSYE